MPIRFPRIGSFKVKWNIRFLTFLHCYLLILHGLYWFIVLHQYYLEHSTIHQLFFYILKKNLPLFLFFINNLTNHHISIRKFFQMIISTIIIVFVIAMIFGVPFQHLTGINWDYPGAIEYLIFAIIFYELYYRQHQNQFTALTWTIATVSVSAMLYELPVCHPQELFYHYTYPTYINPDWLLLGILIVEITKQKLKLKPILIYLPLYLIFNIYYAYNIHILKTTLPYWPWIPRLPTLTLWTIILQCLEPNKKVERKNC